MFRDADERRIRLNLGGNRCDPYQVNRSVFYALVDAIDRNEFDIIPIRMKSGEVDDSATLIPRDQLIAWAKVREEAPSFLFAAMVNPQASDAVPAPIDISLLATRRQLIAAFGSFTGMDMSWFKHLRDTPQLK